MTRNQLERIVTHLDSAIEALVRIEAVPENVYTHISAAIAMCENELTFEDDEVDDIDFSKNPRQKDFWEEDEEADDCV